MTAQKNILVVDDDIQMRALLADFLSTQGYRVQTVGSGTAALPLVISPNANVPDLVISDIKMRPMNGVDLLRRIKAAHPQLPVVMISAFSERDHEKELMAIGARKVLAKPFGLKELADIIRQSIQAV